MGIAGLISLFSMKTTTNPLSPEVAGDVTIIPSPPPAPHAPPPWSPVASGNDLLDGPCEDDDTWSIDASGLYTCKWLAERDPGCLLNGCGTNDDYGQCIACPKTCGVCGHGGQGNQTTLEIALQSIIGSPESLSTILGGSRVSAAVVDETPAVRVAAPLMLTAGVSALAAIALDLSGHAAVSPAAAWLAAMSAFSYVLLLFCGIATYVPLHPDLCTVSWRRLVPLTPQTANLGQIVSFTPQGLNGKHMYAVLIHARFVDIFAEQCLIVSVGIPVLALLILTHTAYTRRLVLRISSLIRTERVVEELKHRLTSRSYAEAEALAKRAEASGGGDGAEHAWLGGGTESDAADCPICMEEYLPTDEVVLLPCRHLMKRECLLSWARTCARQNRDGLVTCPLCKASLITDADAAAAGPHGFLAEWCPGVFSAGERSATMV